MLEIVSSHDQRMDLRSVPAGHLSAAMEQHFHQSNHAGVVDLDPWDFAFARHDGQGQALEERKVDMNIKALGLEILEPDYWLFGLEENKEVLENPHRRVKA